MAKSSRHESAHGQVDEVFFGGGQELVVFGKASVVAHGKRWNVCGFLRGDGELVHLGRAGRLAAREFIAAVETRLLPIRRRPAILVLDNGPCHRSRLVKAKRAEWRRQGLHLFFLPPYCPHLNRIETLWRLVKHHWLPTTAYANFATLRHNVTTLLNTVGLNYRVTFS